jgi:hypothetical protein
MRDLDTYFGSDAKSQSEFLTQSFLTGVLTQPYAYAARVAYQISYALRRPYPNADALCLRTVGCSGHDDGQPFVQKELQRRPEMRSFLLSHDWSGPRDPRYPLAAFPLAEYVAARTIHAFDQMALVAWVLALSVLGVAVARPSQLGLSADRSALWAAPLVIGLYLSSTVVVAMAWTFDIARYREAIAPLALLAFAVTVLQAAGLRWPHVSRAKQTGFLPSR